MTEDHGPMARGMARDKYANRVKTQDDDGFCGTIPIVFYAIRTHTTNKMMNESLYQLLASTLMNSK